MPSGEQPVLILGAGINGCALARELALNGVSVWVIDKGDIAAGATAGSSRLIHGGLRYLEYGEFDLVKESLAERTRLLRLAPQFVRPLRLWIPAENRFGGTLAAVGKFFGWNWWPQPQRPRGSALVRAGLIFYDAYAQDSSLPRYTCGPANVADAPAVDTRIYRRLCSYYDGQVEFPERLVLAMLADARQLAVERGLDMRVYNYHQARLVGRRVEIIPVNGAASAATPLAVEPALVVNATGAWVDQTLQGLQISADRLMGGTKGSHLFSFSAPLKAALAGQGIYAEARDGRPIFITPLGETVLIGTTDLPFEGDPATAITTPGEIDYLIASTNAILPDVGLTPQDIDFHYSAVRPLPYVHAKTTGAITRRHFFVEHPQAPVPIFSVVGGKLTTMRSLAEHAAAQVLAHLGRKVEGNSKERLFPGAEGFPRSFTELDDSFGRFESRLRCSRTSVEVLYKLLGTDAEQVFSNTDDRDLLPDSPLPVAMARWSIRQEHARNLSDLVERRLMLLYQERISYACLRRLADVLTEEGLMSTERREQAVSAEAARLFERYGKTVA